MNASTVVVMTALGSGVLIDLPGLRYEVPLAGEPGPIERDLRWYLPRQPEPLVLDRREDDRRTLPPGWHEQLKVWDPNLRYVPLILDSEQDQDFSSLFVETEEDLRPDSQWNNHRTKDVPKRKWLTDPPLPRYSTTTPFSPEYWVRSAPPESDDIFVIDPAAGESLIAWHLPMMIWGVQGEVYVWTNDGSRWVPVEINVTNSFSGSAYELLLEAIPDHLFSDSISLQLHLCDGGGYNTPSKFRTFVAKIHINESRLPGDFNRDGTLTLADLDAYSAAFAVNAPRADLNRDGRVDGEDLRIYLAAFDANFRP